MVTQILSDFTNEKNKILSIVALKKTSGLVFIDLNHHFNDRRSKVFYDFDHIGDIIDGIEMKLRKMEVIYYTYFAIDFKRLDLVRNSLVGKINIEREFNYDTKLNRTIIEFDDIEMYREQINISFQDFILLSASLLENLVRLIEILVKKIIVHGDTNPHISTPFKTLMNYWENLVRLEYRKDTDPMYVWLQSHKSFFEKYLTQINNLRNRYIHGYGTHLYVDFNNYLVKNCDTEKFVESNPRTLIPELTIEMFTKTVLDNIKTIVDSFLKAAIKNANLSKKKLPM